MAEHLNRTRLRLSLATLLAGACLTVLGSGATPAGAAASRTGTAVAADWSIQPTPAIPEPTGESTDISCASPSFCVSAGSPSAIWDGTSWRQEPLPGSLTSVQAVSCVSPTFCMAMGQAVPHSGGPEKTTVLIWNGTTWVLHPSPVIAGVSLTDVSCSSSSACLAVGGVAARWDGQKWSLLPIPTPKKASHGQLLAVSCSSPSACTTTGGYWVSEKGFALIVRWNGSHLVLQKAAQPPNDNSSYVTGVSCPDDDGCIAVGYTGNPNSGVPYIESWDGTAWTEMTPPSATTVLSGLSCATITVCTAVGTLPAFSAVAAQLSGTTWSLQQAALPRGSRDSSLERVSCVAASDCFAAGDYVSRSNEARSLGEMWNGTQWTVQPTPTQTETPTALLTGVSCAGPGTCTAIGDFTADGAVVDAPNVNDPVAETWNGSSWALTAPVPAAAGDTAPAGISCPAATTCLAVGNYDWGTTHGEAPWAAAWNGTRWVKQIPPQQVRGITGYQLSGVSCMSVTSCVAVGTGYSDRTSRTLAYAWDGVHWTGLRTPSVKNAALYGVSCTSATWCVAVGAGGGHWLSEVWNGTTWAVQPTTATTGRLNAVSCTSPSACTAVGSSRGQPAAEGWDGTNWTAQQPAPVVDGEAFDGVSCTSATACTAVGYTKPDVDLDGVIIQSWDGTSWVNAAIPNSGDSLLASVSCTSPSTCTAAGFQDFGQTPLVESSG
ncbi:MAG TPA: hypothetical protein VHY58_11770 [Streptosporangiaceae bacterium]|nr:hypothetical protein [Streptosporangiaceae bacterium]